MQSYLNAKVTELKLAEVPFHTTLRKLKDECEIVKWTDSGLLDDVKHLCVRNKYIEEELRN